MDNKVTINDIARLTGLSKGTVDRVLHKRGEVSKKSYDKVMKVIEELGYKPNVFASLLAGGKERLIAVLLPAGEKGSFWELAGSGMGKVGADVQALGVKSRLFPYDQYELESFRAACADVLAEEPPRPDNPLLRLDNCIVTPHCAWTSLEARKRLVGIIDRNIDSFVKMSVIAEFSVFFVYTNSIVG